MSKKFKVEITATRILEIPVGGDSGFECLNGASEEETAEQVALENLFSNSFPEVVTDIEGWDVTVESVTPIKDR